MDLPNLKDLGKLLALCRKRGVLEFECGTLKFKLGDAPEPSKATGKDAPKPKEPGDPFANPEWDELSIEDKLLWSARPAGPQAKEPA